jgi:hypothetical protein
MSNELLFWYLILLVKCFLSGWLVCVVQWRVGDKEHYGSSRCLVRLVGYSCYLSSVVQLFSLFQPSFLGCQSLVHCMFILLPVLILIYCYMDGGGSISRQTPHPPWPSGLIFVLCSVRGDWIEAQELWKPLILNHYPSLSTGFGLWVQAARRTWSLWRVSVCLWWSSLKKSIASAVHRSGDCQKHGLWGLCYPTG